MAYEIFAWGYTAWCSRCPTGYEVVGYIDGNEFHAISNAPDSAERQFCRAARYALLRRKLRALRGLPPREFARVSSADTYHDVPLAVVIVALLQAVVARMYRWLGTAVSRGDSASQESASEPRAWKGALRRTTFGIATAVVGQVMSSAAVVAEFVATPAQVCRPATANAWLITAAMGPLLVLVGVALFVDGRAKRSGEREA